MSPTDNEKRERLEQLRKEAAQLEKELELEENGKGGPVSHWQATEYYGAYHATSGLVLGIAGAVASLLFNILGSLIVGQHPLRLIQVYLTFPLGEKALSADFQSGIAMAVGCCLYIGTGMVLGVPFQMVMARLLPKGSLSQRMLLATVLGLLLWAVNFYGILAWLQPLLIGGNWIVDGQLLPPWVGAATHLVFAWTMALLAPWGAYVPYHRQTEIAKT